MKVNRQCMDCGTTEGIIRNSKKYGKMLCDKCYQTYRFHGRVVEKHELPEYGEVKKDSEGRYICHVCGRSYKKVLTHVWQKHNMSAIEYKKKFGLDTTVGLAASKTKEKLRKSVGEHYDKVVVENLLEQGAKTRFEDGHMGRVSISEQTKRRLIKQDFGKGIKK